MNIKEILEAHNITQATFAKYLGMTREGLNLSINHGKQKKTIEHSLKLFLAERHGLSFELRENKIILTLTK